MKTKIISFLSLILLFSVNIFSQDIIEFKNGDKKEVVIKEITDKKIKYTNFDNPDSVIYVKKKKDIKKITFENGKIKSFESLNPRSNNKFGLGFQLGGPTGLTSVYLNYFFTPNFNLEAGFGILGAYAGLKYHFGDKNEPIKWTPYIGLNGNYILGLFNDDLFGIYIPIGLQYMSAKGFVFAPEIALIANENTAWPWVALKIGYNF